MCWRRADHAPCQRKLVEWNNVNKFKNDHDEAVSRRAPGKLSWDPRMGLGARRVCDTWPGRLHARNLAAGELSLAASSRLSLPLPTTIPTFPPIERHGRDDGDGDTTTKRAPGYDVPTSRPQRPHQS